VPNGVVTYGDTDVRLPHLVCLGVEGVEAEAVLLGLDQAGIAAHSGSACSSESLEPSPVLEAMGVDAERSLRVSVGWSTGEDDIDAFLGALPDVVSRLRALGATDR
jgi:cysteine desulfurase